MPHRASSTLIALLASCSLIVGAPSGSTPTANAQGESQLTTEQLLTDFIHYVKIDQKTLAESFGNALLERGLSAVEFAGLIEDSPQTAQRFDEAVRRAMRDESLEGVASSLFRLYQQGRLDRARDPAEVTRNIELLGETQRARMLARERLLFASEYAAPQLLEALSRGSQPMVQAETQELLVRMGGSVVAPLSVALLGAEPALQERLARILGRIGYTEAIPFLTETARTTASADVRRAALRAIGEIDPQADPSASLGALYVGLGERHFGRPLSLTRFPDEEFQLAWSFEPGVGLFAIPVLTDVFHESMAMRLAERALRLDPTTHGAVTLWIAANFNRETLQPLDYDNPFYGPERRSAMYYAVAAGERPLEAVLARALRDRDTALARLAIAALSRVAGGAAMWSGASEDHALIAALLYPDRRVQFEAALVLARAHAQEPFPGSERVVPILASAIRDGADRFAVVIASEMERQQSLMRTLQSMGYTVLPPAASLSEAMNAIADAPGVDVIVSDLTGARTTALVEQVRTSARLGATPVLALLPSAAYNQLAVGFETEPLTRAVRAGVTEEQLGASISSLVERASGPALTQDQVRAYSLDALRSLRDLAISGSRVYMVSDALRPLLLALERTEGRVRLDLAEVLAHIGDREAQNRLMETALNASGSDRIALLRTASESARRHGTMLDDRLVRRVEQLTHDADIEIATAAAAVMGSLNLPDDRLAPLILGVR
ncbi:MAG: HEAT repeat domain-containing protein [Phycisphaerales bacterium]|nr:MAG: HEAT repeat domain-containing protein [Phycisphaerales bacterium]